ncbi:hypothetical protein Pelo_5967 [Pelomyxa schiedti]|nr:hypothetical protein Pelo_5967 [Pelomyxa schiedti]
MLSVIGTYSTLPSVITPRISLCAFCAILGLSTALLSVCIMQQCRKKEERAMSPALGIRRVNVGHSFDWDREDLYNLFDPHRRIYQKEWEEELKRVASGQHPSVEPLP